MTIMLNGSDLTVTQAAAAYDTLPADLEPLVELVSRGDLSATAPLARGEVRRSAPFGSRWGKLVL